MREARQVDNLFWHLERYFKALDIDDEKEKVQTVVMYLNDTAALRWRCHYADGCDVKTWEKFKHELKRQFYPESIIDIAMINLQWMRKKGSIREYMFERQRLCFFVDGLQQWVATELWRREPYNLSSAMMIVERLGDFKQCERPRSPRHERAKGRGDGRLKSGSPKATDDERNEEEGRYCLHKGEKEHEGSRKQGDTRDYKAYGGPRGGCFHGSDPYYRKDCQHKGKMIAFLKKHKGNKGDSSSSDGEACMGTWQMVASDLSCSRAHLHYSTTQV
ncbi:hypothetical protein RJ639_022785 [Escallonia herrerae]|uniref:Retrotransposon gag domain-containing protein n=1 Tax=Escallonia herrerae TaxID=1293975 RepID=A0AA89AEE6_9ASTE|nr:hypothetical protein RJ639_022785 [Escallonia herrerae]